MRQRHFTDDWRTKLTLFLRHRKTILVVCGVDQCTCHASRRDIRRSFFNIAHTLILIWGKYSILPEIYLQSTAFRLPPLAMPCQRFVHFRFHRQKSRTWHLFQRKKSFAGWEKALKINHGKEELFCWCRTVSVGGIWRSWNYALN